MHAPNPAETYLIEAHDLLDQVEEIVLEVEKHPDDSERINRLFRAFHTIKGSGAMFGFDAVAEFTHHVESLLDQLRRGAIAVSPDLVGAILSSRDHIHDLLASGTTEPGKAAAAGNALVARLQNLASRTSAEPAPATADTAEAIRPESGTAQSFRIRFRPGPALAETGLDPVLLLEELRGLGSVSLELDASAIGPLGAQPPTECHLGWTIDLTTDRGVNAIRDVFIFAEDASEVRIDSMPAPSAGGDDAANATERGAAPTEPSRNSATAAGPERPVAVPNPGTPRDSVVRVPSPKLDHLVSLVGELVMNQSRLTQVASRLTSSDLAASVESIERLISELRDAVLGIRMMPIGTTFSRFKRLVHDLARDLGKEVDLVTEGADTELDKTVLDQLADPLVHLIRNSIDHGIGTPAQRRAAGKSERGTIRLTASHEGSHVVVTIADDGRGLDAAAIQAKAVEQGLLAPDATPTEAEIFNLIFLPGFSTAKSVTTVSGRGVGMDVVRRQIEALRGSIQLTSRPGQGTSLSLALPLTLAIIDGLLVSVAGDPYIVPMSAVAENVELHREDRQRHNGRNLIAVRGELVPYIHLRELFGIPGEAADIEKIVIIRFGPDRVGLVVDRVLGSHQTVIQSLGRAFRDIAVVSGCTILGDGRVALILDVGGVVAAAGTGAERGGRRPMYAVATAA